MSNQLDYLRHLLVTSITQKLLYLATLKYRVDQVVCVLPGSPVLRVDEEDEVAEAEIAEEHADRLHRFPVKS